MYIKLLAVFLLQTSLSAWAVSTPPKEDIHFLAEHLAEGAQDARYFAMPWPVGDYDDSGWKPLVSVAGARVTDEFAAASGSLLTVGLSRALNNHWALQMVAYYDSFSVSGSSTNNSLTTSSFNAVPPLDIPETAVFSRPRGDFEHTGIGFFVTHNLDYGDSWHWDLLGGILIEKLKLINYQFDFELTGGANAGVTGILDYSSNNSLQYLLLGLQAGRKHGDTYEIIPGIILGIPYQNGEFTTRLIGPGFDLSTASAGDGQTRIGDGFTYIGMTVRDMQNHFEMNLGAMLGYQAFEYYTHEGIKSALLVSLTWRM